MTGKTLRAWRERRGWTQGELARKLGVQLLTVSRWERKISDPQPRHLRKLKALKEKS